MWKSEKRKCNGGQSHDRLAEPLIRREEEIRHTRVELCGADQKNVVFASLTSPLPCHQYFEWIRRLGTK